VHLIICLAIDHFNIVWAGCLPLYDVMAAVMTAVQEDRATTTTNDAQCRNADTDNDTGVPKGI